MDDQIPLREFISNHNPIYYTVNQAYLLNNSQLLVHGALSVVNHTKKVGKWVSLEKAPVDAISFKDSYCSYGRTSSSFDF